jgi:hypothetical protein
MIYFTLEEDKSNSKSWVKQSRGTKGGEYMWTGLVEVY